MINTDNDIEIDIESLQEDRISKLEMEIHELQNVNIELLELSDNLKQNLAKLIENYPKDLILEKINNNKCSICLEKYKLHDDIAMTNCLHLFHRHCIDESIDNNKLTCPNCRFKLENSIFLYIKFELEYKGTEIL